MNVKHLTIVLLVCLLGIVGFFRIGVGFNRPVLSAEPSIRVSPPIRVSSRNGGPHFWWTIATDPENKRNLIICALRNRPDIPSDLQAVLYGSQDGGRSWHMLYQDTRPASTSEASCAFGSQGAIYFAASNAVDSIAPSQFIKSLRKRLNQMQFSRSLDFGKHWFAAPPAPYADSADIVVARGAKPARDRVSVFADSGRNQYMRALSISTNGARKFNSTISLSNLPGHIPQSGSAGNGFGEFLGGVTRLPNGTMDAVYSDHPFGSNTTGKLFITVNRVAPNGNELGTPSVVAPVTNLGFLRSYRREPSIAAGRVPGTKKWRVYVAWTDTMRGRSRVLLAFSDNDGRTWSSPRIIDDLPAHATSERDTSASNPSLAVNGNGIVAIDWNEFDGRCWRFSYSKDAGISFTRSAAINSCNLRPVSQDTYLNDYLVAMPPFTTNTELRIDDWRKLYENLLRGTGLVAVGDSRFYATWVAFGNGRDALYCSAIDVDNSSLTSIPTSPLSSTLLRRKAVLLKTARHAYVARASRTVAHESSGITPAANHPLQGWLNYTKLHYDSSTRELTVGVVLVRRADRALTWPVVLRVRQLDSSFGSPVILNADNGVRGKGATWVFAGPAVCLKGKNQAANLQRLPTDFLRQYSEPRILRFRIPSGASKPRPSFGDPHAHILDVQFDLV